MKGRYDGVGILGLSCTVHHTNSYPACVGGREGGKLRLLFAGQAELLNNTHACRINNNCAMTISITIVR